MDTFTRCVSDLKTYAHELFSSIGGEKTLGTETLRVLFQYQLDRCVSGYVLIANGLVWDAEVVIRVVYEAAAKMAFIGAHNPERRAVLVEEYWQDLAATYDRKGADKAKKVEGFARRHGSPDDVRIFKHLQNPRTFDLDGGGNRKSRNDIEQRWAFSGITRELSRTSSEHMRFDGFESLGHAYGIASNIAHVNSKALDLMEDRATRGSDLISLEAAHICRMLSDMVSLSCFSLMFVNRYISGKFEFDARLKAIFEALAPSTQDLQDQFDRSQDAFYAEQDIQS